MVGAAVVGAAVVGAAVVGAAVVGAAVVGAAVVGAAVLVLGSRPQNLKLLAVCPAFGEFPAYKQKSPAGAVKPFTLVHRLPISAQQGAFGFGLVQSSTSHTSSPQHRPPVPVQFVEPLQVQPSLFTLLPPPCWPLPASKSVV